MTEQGNSHRGTRFLVIAAALVIIIAGIYQTRIQEQVLALKTLLASKGIAVTDKILLERVDPGAVMRLTADLVTGLSAVLSNIVLIQLTVTFILLEASSFPVKLRTALGDPPAVFPQFTRYVDDIKRYMITKTFISLTTGILSGTWLSILGVDFPVLWGFLAFLLNYIPNLGSIIAAVPAWFSIVGIGQNTYNNKRSLL